jgi:hypothetical protein
LNSSTIDIGSRLELFINDCDAVYGDALQRTVARNGATDVSALAKRPVRLRFALRDADLYSLQFK